MKKFTTCLIVSVISCLSASFASAAAIDKKAENGFDQLVAVAVSAPLIGGQEAVLAKNDTAHAATVIQAKADHTPSSIDIGAMIVEKYPAATHKDLAAGYALEKMTKMAAAAVATDYDKIFASHADWPADTIGELQKVKHFANELAAMQRADQPTQGGYAEGL
jgi:hypothetical protein